MCVIDGNSVFQLHAAGGSRVVGVDVDADQIDQATATRPSETVGYLLGDVMGLDLDARFDLVTCYAALHHLGSEAVLRRLAELTAPGGSLLVVGLTRRSTQPVDAAWDLARLLGIRLSSRRHPSLWEHGAPVAEPEETHAELLRAASVITPGAVIRRRLYWRYSLVWRKPAVRPGR